MRLSLPRNQGMQEVNNYRQVNLKFYSTIKLLSYSAFDFLLCPCFFYDCQKSNRVTNHNLGALTVFHHLTFEIFINVASNYDLKIY